MINIKKLVVIIFLPLIFANTVIAETYPISKKKQQNTLNQQSKVKDSNILAEEYFNIGRSCLKLGQYEEAIKNYDLAIKYKQDYGVPGEAWLNKEVGFLSGQGVTNQPEPSFAFNVVIY